MELTIFRRSIFDLSNRRFGTLAEIMIKRLLHFKPSGTVYHDLLDGNERIEVKFSRAVQKYSTKFNEKTLLQVLSTDTADRAFMFGEWHETNFSCNIQHVKPDEFDKLFYGVFFSDRVLVFLLTPKDLENKEIGFARQTLGNTSEGQFSLNVATMKYHLDNYHLLTLSYSDLLTLFRN